MPQKIVIQVEMHCDKCRSKALKVAAVADGVTSVAIEGKDKNQVVVIGERIDSANLTCLMRKKVGYATLVSVGEAKKQTDDKKDDKKTVKQDPTPWIPGCSHYPQYQVYEIVHDESPSICSIL